MLISHSQEFFLVTSDYCQQVFLLEVHFNILDILYTNHSCLNILEQKSIYITDLMHFDAIE